MAPRSPLAPLAVFFLVGSACDSGPSLSEALAAQNQEQLPPDYKPNPKPRPKGLEGPTDAEFKAWNRKDPEGEKHLYKWDKAHLKEMLNYWEDLQCFRDKMKAEGEKAFGVEPGTPQEEQWYQFKQAFIPFLDGWQQRLFAEVPRLLEKSKFTGNLLEAHELLMHGYPTSYNESDKTEIEKNDAHWLIVEAKVKKYTKSLGGDWPAQLEPGDNAKAAEAHAKACEEALKPPDRSGKVKKRKRKKGEI